MGAYSDSNILLVCWRGTLIRWRISTRNGSGCARTLSSERVVSEELARAGAVDIPDDQVEQIQKVVAYIQENTEPNENIFDFTSQGAYYFFANRPGVSRFHQVSYASTPAMQEEVIEAARTGQNAFGDF